MTTTTCYLGWSGFSTPADETKFNEKIVARTNRLLKKLHKSEVTLCGDCALDIHADVLVSRTATVIAETYRSMDGQEPVRETTDELLLLLR